MSENGLDRQTESIIGMVFLVGMILTFIIAIVSFDGPPTILLIVLSVLFLILGVFFLTGSSSRGEADAYDGSSQSQSVVLGHSGVRVAQQGPGNRAGQVYEVCTGCGGRAPEGARFCPGCGQAMAA